MWVPRTPKRPDFCGCPPCPLCFCWAGGDSLMDGMQKFTLDVLGEPRTPTAAEKQTLEESAERIHTANLARGDQPIEPLDRDALIAAADEADRQQGIQRQTDYLLKLKRREAAAPKPLNTVTCDGMDLGYIEKEAEQKKRPKKVEEPSPWPVGIPAFVSMYDEMMRREVTRAFGIPPTFLTFDVDTAPIKPLVATPDQPPLTDKDRRRIQAEEDAKKRMKEMAREPIRR